MGDLTQDIETAIHAKWPHARIITTEKEVDWYPDPVARPWQNEKELQITDHLTWEPFIVNEDVQLPVAYAPSSNVVLVKVKSIRPKETNSL